VASRISHNRHESRGPSAVSGCNDGFCSPLLLILSPQVEMGLERDQTSSYYRYPKTLDVPEASNVSGDQKECFGDLLCLVKVAWFAG
jgi:hypothetical protein